jgi:hypothetical protein
MIRWYDYIAAFVMADSMLTAAFFPYIGFFIAYALYEYGWNWYCEYRKVKEIGQ